MFFKLFFVFISLLFVSTCKCYFVALVLLSLHILSNSISYDDDIKREIQNLYIRTNIVISRFCRCSTRVKRILFKSYCLCFYDIALWKHYFVTVLSKFKSCYHKCIKKLFGFSRSDSMSGILIQLSLASFDTIIHNSSISFESHCSSSENTVTMHLCIACLYVCFMPIASS